MIRQILHSGRFILEILLVGALVVLFFWWNPLHIFGGKPELQPTANIVSEIREVGEMITAEYYGEVLASIDEAQINLLEEEDIRSQAEFMYQEIKTALENLRNFHTLSAENRLSIGNEDNSLNRRERKRLLIDPVNQKNILEKLYFLEDWANTSQMALYDEVFHFIGLEAGFIRSGNSISDKQARQVLMGWYERPENNWWQPDGFVTDFFENRLSNLSRRESRKKLAMIGRGTVKAGFDFKDLDQSMYHFNEDMGELHFFGLAPKVLNSDINPWFIPEKGIPGFDILTYNGKVDFKDSRKVKIYAVQKLKTNARNAGIIEQAEKNGAETLSRLFSLLTGKEIKKVIFHHDKIIQLTKEINADRYISYEEAVQFEKTIKQELTSIDSLRAASEDRYNNRNLAENKWNTLLQMIAQVQQLEFEAHALPYNFYSTFWYNITRDSLIDQTEWRTIKKYARAESAEKRSLQLWSKNDSLWFQASYSEGLYQLLKENIPIGSFSVDSTSLEAWKSMEKPLNRIKNVSFHQEGVVFEYFQPQQDLRDSLYQLMSPLRYNPVKFEQWVSQKNTIETIGQMDTVQSLSADPEGFWLLDARKNEGLFKINVPLDQVTLPDIFANDALPDGSQLSLDSMVIFKSTNDFPALRNNPSSSSNLSQDQKEMLKRYLSKLYSSHKTYHGRDFLTKTKSWFAEKWESKSSLTEKFQ